VRSGVFEGGKTNKNPYFLGRKAQAERQSCAL
jgi:hypothetical protein